MKHKGRPTEILEVENFLSIKKAKIEIKPMTILIGDNAVGKSVISKLVYMMRDVFFKESLRESIRDAISEAILIRDSDDIDKTSLKLNWRFSFENYLNDVFPAQYYGDDNFKIAYKIDNWIVVSITKTKGKRVRINFGRRFFEWAYDTISELVRQELESVRLEIEEDDYKEIYRRVPLIAFRVEDRLNAKIFGISEYVRNLFVPHARTMYLYIDLLDIEKRYERFDELMKSFLSITDGIATYIRRRMSLVEDNTLRDYLKYESKVIKGKLRIEDDNVYIVIGNQEFDIYHISSGQQELLPLILLLRYGLILRRSGGVLRLCVEEPETHLFPTTQRDLAYLFGFMHNLNTEFLITTHSPYILTALNNLLLAKSLYKETKNKEIKEKYEKIWIDSRDIAVYEVKDGYVKNIIDEEGLIEARAIDEVSDEIVMETDEMLEIAYGKEEKKENSSE